MFDHKQNYHRICPIMNSLPHLLFLCQFQKASPLTVPPLWVIQGFLNVFLWSVLSPSFSVQALPRRFSYSGLWCIGLPHTLVQKSWTHLRQPFTSLKNQWDQQRGQGPKPPLVFTGKGCLHTNFLKIYVVISPDFIYISGFSSGVSGSVGFRGGMPSSDQLPSDADAAYLEEHISVTTTLQHPWDTIASDDLFFYPVKSIQFPSFISSTALDTKSSQQKYPSHLLPFYVNPFIHLSRVCFRVWILLNTVYISQVP